MSNGNEDPRCTEEIIGDTVMTIVHDDDWAAVIKFQLTPHENTYPFFKSDPFVFW